MLVFMSNMKTSETAAANDNLFTDKLRTVRIRGARRWTVSTYATAKSDGRGQTGIAYRILCDGALVAQSANDNDLVYGSPLSADDSDRAVASVIALVCDAAKEEGADWDAEDLDDAAALRFSE